MLMITRITIAIKSRSGIIYFCLKFIAVAILIISFTMIIFNSQQPQKIQPYLYLSTVRTSLFLVQVTCGKQVKFKIVKSRPFSAPMHARTRPWGSRVFCGFSDRHILMQPRYQSRCKACRLISGRAQDLRVSGPDA